MRKCKICKKEGAVFSLEKKAPYYCAEHKTDDMKNHVSTKCVVCQKVAPSYKYIGEIYTHCSKCAKKVNETSKIKLYSKNELGPSEKKERKVFKTSDCRPLKAWEDMGFIEDTNYVRVDTEFKGTCRCGTVCFAPRCSFSETKRFCTNENCEFFLLHKKFCKPHMKYLMEQKNCIVHEIDDEPGVKANIIFTCSCGTRQKTTWSKFYNDKKWCSNRDCEYYRKTNTEYTTEIVTEILINEGYTMISDYEGIHERFNTYCPEGHLHNTSLEMWKNGSRCKTCNGNGRTLSYFQLKEFYEKLGLTLLLQEHEYKGNCTTVKIPYKCSENHIIDNLSKNNVEVRVKQGLNPCKFCHERKEATEEIYYIPIEGVWWRYRDFYNYFFSPEGLCFNSKTNSLTEGSVNAEYIRIVLYKNDGTRQSFLLHRIIAEIFCSGRTEERNIVNHKDGNPLNNKAENLEWVTIQENARHAADTGLIPKTLISVRRVDTNGQITEYSSLKEASDLNPNVGYLNIINTCAGRQKTSGGYIWEYIESKKKIGIPENSVQVKNFPNYYITRDGKVYSLRKKDYMTPWIHDSGYLMVDLAGCEYQIKTGNNRERNNRRQKFRVHRLVAEHFLENPLELKEVNHKDKNKKNNNVENLEWITGEDNLRHAHNVSIIQYNTDQKEIGIFSSIREAFQKTGINEKNISTCLKRNSEKGTNHHTAGGFFWRYYSEVYTD